MGKENENRMLESGETVLFQSQFSEERFGHCWSVNSKKTTTDLYLNNTFTRDPIHLSFHQSGEWHVTFPPEAPNSKPQRLAVSTERKELAPGWYHASRIVVFKDDAVLPSEVKTAIKIPFHHKYNAICIDIYIGKLDSTPFGIKEGFRIANLQMGMTHQAEICAIPYDSVDSRYETFQEVIIEVKQQLIENGWDGKLTSFVLICDTDKEYGYIQQIELAIEENQLK